MPPSGVDEKTINTAHNNGPIIDAVKNLYTARKYTDLTITAGSQAFKVNKSVVCLRSPVLAKECDGAFMEAAGIINTAHDADALEAFLEYLYTGRYRGMPQEAQTDSPGALTNAGTASSEEVSMAADSPSEASNRTALGGIGYQSSAVAILHAKVYALGEYYQVLDLKTYVATFFEQVIIRTAPDTFSLAVEEVYGSTPSEDRQLRDIVVATALRRGHELRNQINFQNLADFANDYIKAPMEFSQVLKDTIDRKKE